MRRSARYGQKLYTDCIRWLLPCALLALAGCLPDHPGELTFPADTAIGDDGSGDLGDDDGDDDGYSSDEDCDDSDADVNPGAEEVPYDGVDNDCDEATPDDDLDGDGALYEDDCDDDDASLNLDDLDGDGVDTCGGDCDDTEETGALQTPGTAEICDDGIDNNCYTGDNFTSCWGDVTSVGDRFRLINGIDVSDHAGTSLAFMGDLNPPTEGEGFIDIVIGAENVSGGVSGAGAAYVVFGPQSDEDLNLSVAAAVIRSTTGGAQAGAAVLRVDDVDGDERDDLLIASPGAGSSGEADVIVDDFNTRIDVSDSFMNFAVDADSTGNVISLGEDSASIFIGATAGHNDSAQITGAVYEVPIADAMGGLSADDATRVYYGEETGDRAGASVLRYQSDCYGEGVDYLLIGAPGADGTTGSPDSGAVYVVDLGTSLSNPMSLASATFKIVGSTNYTNIGVSLALAGDMDGDGCEDVVVGAPGTGGGGTLGGRAFLINDFNISNAVVNINSVSIMLNGEVGDGAGTAVSGAGDVNGDGLDDLLIGAPDLNAGGVWLVQGPLDSGSTSMQLSTSANALFISGEDSGDQAGASVIGGEDLDNDGLDDFLIGAPMADGAGFADSGEVYLFLGMSY